MISICKYIYNFLHGKQKIVFCVILCVFFPLFGHSQRLSQAYLDYISRYREVALQHQLVFGIPASITLAQGLLESSAGQSHLAVNGNNHFGVKSHHWMGETVCYGNPDKQVCYRKYGSVEDSFQDHSLFLKGKRYSKLFDYDINDYRSWAKGLSECGYAEDPDYARKLISIIEQYQLHLLAEDEHLLSDVQRRIDKEKKEKEKEEREKEKKAKKDKKRRGEKDEVPPRKVDKKSNELAVVPPAKPKRKDQKAEVPPAPSRAEINAQVARNARRNAANRTNASADND